MMSRVLPHDSPATTPPQAHATQLSSSTAGSPAWTYGSNDLGFTTYDFSDADMPWRSKTYAATRNTPVQQILRPPSYDPQLGYEAKMKGKEIASSLKHNRTSSGNFGALIFDFQRKAWTGSHIIENNGDIESRTSDWRSISEPSRFHIDPSMAMHVAGVQGLAAGKIYLNPEYTEWSFVCSGICFERKYFITTCHFKFKPGLMGASSMKIPGNHVARISTARWSQFSDNSTTRAAYLVDADEAQDIALFRLEDREADWAHYATLDQLVATDDYDYRDVFAGQRVWSVGYATEEDNRYRQYWEALNILFSQNEWQKQIMAERNETSPPDFASIYHPYKRILVMGLLESAPQQDPTSWKHDIPGWFGMSGSMIGQLFVEGTEVKARILGIFKSGDKFEDFNRFTPFTSALIGILGSVVSQNS